MSVMGFAVVTVMGYSSGGRKRGNWWMRNSEADDVVVGVYGSLSLRGDVAFPSVRSRNESKEVVLRLS